MWQVFYADGHCDWVSEGYIRFVMSPISKETEEAIKNHEEIRGRILTFRWRWPRLSEIPTTYTP